MKIVINLVLFILSALFYYWGSQITSFIKKVIPDEKDTNLKDKIPMWKINFVQLGIFIFALLFAEASIIFFLRSTGSPWGAVITTNFIVFGIYLLIQLKMYLNE